MFINSDPEEASAQRGMYVNFKAWVEQHYPYGISEEDWEEIETTTYEVEK